jgi:glycosyltransferase involved in cell wall biosynthesis
LKASVIVPSYNRVDALRSTLSGLARQTAAAGSFEVIVADDGSIDDLAGSLVILEAAAPVRLLRQDNRGAGVARNLGARHAQGELLIFLDADMVPSPGLVEMYLAAFASQPAAIHIGRILAWPAAFQTLFDRVTRVEMNHDLGPAPRQLAFYHLASGNFAIGAGTFQLLGGFDEALRMTEDTDLGYRAEYGGVALRYCPEAIGYHNHPKTLEERCHYVEHSAYWSARLLHKHPEMAPLLPIYEDILPLSLRRDRLDLMARKLGRRALAIQAVYGGLRSAIAALERGGQSSALLRSCYWKALSAKRVIGFRRGWQYSPAAPE